MGRDNVTFKFRIDLTQMTVKGKQAIQILDEIAIKSGRASNSVARLGTSSAKAGQQTAAAAINFQTATQGMLNLSTAAVQTYTSISNLDRANNRAKMSVIAVARAEDLLANKLERQNTLRDAGQKGSQKDINITKEIATAKADLTVKTEKMGIEQAAVNDIYMLFASNIANVTISSMQTIAILDKNSVILNGAKALGMKLNNFLSINAARAAYSEAAAQAVNSTSKVVATGVTGTLTVAMYGLAAATRAVVAANPLLMIAMAGLTVAWAVHETNILGTKTAMDEYLGVADDNLKIMEAERLAANGLSQANANLEKSYTKLSPVAKRHYEMLRDFQLQRGDVRGAAYSEAQLMGARPQGFSPSVGSSSGGGTGTGGTGYASGSGMVSATSSATASSINPGWLPGSFADTGANDSSTSVSAPIPVGKDLADPFGTVLQQELYKGLNPIQKRTTNIVLAQQQLDAGRKGAASKYIQQADQLTAAANNYVPDKHFTFEDLDKSGNFFGVNNAQKKAVIDPSVRNLKYGIDISTREGIDPDSTRGKVLNKTGRDIGSIGQFIDVNEGIRLANLQTTMSGFSNTKGGKSALLAEALALGGSDHGGLSKGTIDTISGFGAVARNKAYNIALGNGQLSATAAYQVPKGSVRASAGFYARLRMKDSNTNRLNLMGGTRVPGIPMDQEGAVVGGFSSRREHDQAMKYRAAVADRANVQFGAFFGVGINYAAIYGRSSARSQQSQLNSKVEGIRSTLSSAGLGYKTTNARYRRGQGPEHFASVMAEWANVRSYNANQLSKARSINTLQQFGQSQFFGSGLSLPSLQDAIAKQDERVTTIGLNRTEAFQIIGSTGRGVDEIDARVLWKNRVNNISTGTSVL